MNNTSKNIVAGLIILGLIVLLVVTPLVSIWSANTLFGLNIAYTFWTWFAALWMQTVVIAPKIKTK
jgi:hypothetical protein